MARPKGKGGSPSKPSGGMSPGERELVNRAKSTVDEARLHDQDLPQKEDRGFGGNERDDPPGDPTRKTGIGFLDAVDDFFQQSQTPQDITPPTERTGPGFNPPNDELNAGLLFPVKPPEEEEPPIVPGDPDDLGERERRRRSRDDVNASPVLRRGLLGV